jgi:hypothetical protein
MMSVIKAPYFFGYPFRRIKIALKWPSFVNEFSTASSKERAQLYWISAMNDDENTPLFC